MKLLCQVAEPLLDFWLGLKVCVVLRLGRDCNVKRLFTFRREFDFQLTRPSSHLTDTPCFRVCSLGLAAGQYWRQFTLLRIYFNSRSSCSGRRTSHWSLSMALGTKA